jgi:hypothetical protein
MRRLGQAMAVLIVLAVSAGVIHAKETPAQKCAVAKQKAAATKMSAKLKCWQKAIASGAANAAPACLTAAETKFNTAIGKAETKGGCSVTGEEADVMRITGHKTASVFRRYDLGDVDALRSRLSAARAESEQRAKGTRQISQGQGVIDAPGLWSRFGIGLSAAAQDVRGISTE